MTRFERVFGCSLMLAAVLLPRTGQALPTFRVDCEDPARHAAANDPDLLPHAEELALLRAAIEDVYPHLPAKLKPIAANIGFVVIHKDASISKNFLGCSAEDDAYYQYPDKALYHPERSPRGTIRLAVTEKFMKGLKLMSELCAGQPALRDGMNRFVRSFLAHELLHAWQYHTNPVPDPKKTPHGMIDGLAEEWVIEGLRAKMQYEHDAFELHRTFMSSSITAMADAMDVYARANAAEFEPGARYQLLAINNPQMSFVTRYLRGEVEAMNDGPRFNATADLVYYGQLRPVEAVANLYRLNERFRRDGFDRALLLAVLPSLVTDWRKYMVDSKVAPKLKAALGYPVEVEKRFHVELARLREVTRDVCDVNVHLENIPALPVQ